MFQPLRIAFMGTPDFVTPAVQSLIDGPHDLVCLYTQPPREKGRKKQIEKTSVHLLGEGRGIEVRHPINFKSDNDIQAFQDLNLDVAIVAAYGMLLPQVILDAPKHGCFNIHPSLLPRWRGPSPIQYAIWKGDQETGVSLMSLVKAMDAGPIIAQDKVDIGADTTFQMLNKQLWEKGTALLSNCLDGLAETGELQTTPQNEDDVTYCKLLTKEHGRIDFNQTAEEIDQQIRGLNPWPGTWCLDQNEKRLKILSASLSDNTSDERAGKILSDGKIVCGNKTVLKLTKIQPENKKSMDIQDALNGAYLKQGDSLS